MLLTLTYAHAPCPADVAPVLGDAEHVDDGVDHHRHQRHPHKQDLLLELIAPRVEHAEVLGRVYQGLEADDIHRGLGGNEHQAEGDGQLVEPV